MLDFTLAPEECSRLYDTLLCLGKVSDSVTIEARPNQLALTALNSTKSAYSSFVFETPDFFTSFNFLGDDLAGSERFACRILNKALLSVFKIKSTDPRGGETALERCEVSVEDHADRTECRFNIKMVHRHGVTKTHRLTYEAVEVMHALFDRNRATNRWKIKSKMLRGIMEYFGAKTEQLDIYAEVGKVTFTSYTEKIMHGKEVLKQPLQTAVTVDTKDFDEFNAVDNLHIAINVKDFKNMVLHAQTLNSSVSAMYSLPSRPLQFSYSSSGMRCEFTLMTIGGDARAAATTTTSRTTTRETPNRHQSLVSNNSTRAFISDMLPPQRPGSRSVTNQVRRLGNRSTPEQNIATEDDPESLFVPPDDDDQQWDPTGEHDGNNDEDMLGWDTSAEHDAQSHATFQDSANSSKIPRLDGAKSYRDVVIEPTQHASQVRGLFD